MGFDGMFGRCGLSLVSAINAFVRNGVTLRRVLFALRLVGGALARSPRGQLFQESLERDSRKHARKLIEQMRRKIHSRAVLPSQVHRGDLRALMAEFTADGLACECILLALLRCERHRDRAAGGRGFPAG